MGQSLGGAFDVGEWFFPAIPPSYDALHERLVWIKNEAPGGPSSEIPGMLVLPRSVSQETDCFGERRLGKQALACVIYFHPNACDIGDSLPEMEVIRDSAFDGKVAILAPEYPGYGLLDGFNPSPRGVDIVAEAAWRFAIDRLGFNESQVVLWGRSIGTGPATSLALRVASGKMLFGDAEQPTAALNGVPESKAVNLDNVDTTGAVSSEADVPLGALVLMATMTSISGAVAAHAGAVAAAFVDSMWEIDKYVADDSMIHVPVCVIHPEDDSIIPKSQGERVLANACARHKLGVWLCGEGHNVRSCSHHLAPVRGFLLKHCQCLRFRRSIEL
eukprot:gnl/TRDRNA2_/TRDRNA2_189159_c0_seq1.p1 gnl/TRDRNA2_/TRDRNA2_189159_c0~~gnl/TRDRNA2_/TRDRNA2_189159_c0_seq1.p1  ORF type:complete len:368 (+),score=51.44 gnl/TRDRNA2_/TRDRNA2_189159_c0_seq1:112-1104(+)